MKNSLQVNIEESEISLEIQVIWYKMIRQFSNKLEKISA